MTCRGVPIKDLTRGYFVELRELLPGKPAPEIEGEDADGKRFKLSDYRGKVVLLSFWGTSCSECMAQVPYQQTLVKRYADKPFVVLGVNSDTKKEDLQEAAKKNAITWRSWWDGGSPKGLIAQRWNIHTSPTFYLIDAEGVIRYMRLPQHRIEAALDELLAEVKGQGKR